MRLQVRLVLISVAPVQLNARRGQETAVAPPRHWRRSSGRGDGVAARRSGWPGSATAPPGWRDGGRAPPLGRRRRRPRSLPHTRVIGQATGRRPPGHAGHRAPGEAAGHQDVRSGWTRRTCARRPCCAGSAGTCCARPKTGAPRSGGGHGGQRRRGRGVLPGCTAAVRVGGDPCGHPQALLGQ